MPLPFGKIDHKQLAGLLKRYRGASDPAVRLGPAVGQDAAAVRVGGQTLVVATDPVTFATDRIGWYAVHVNANDVAVSGAVPRWFQACLLLPPCGPELPRRIFADIHKSCRKLGVAVTGGHTEVTVGLDRPIIVHSGGARAGHLLVATKGIVIEGTALIALEKADALAGKVSAACLRRAARFLTRPGISVVPEAVEAARLGARAMHDPTEGGLLTGIWEMAEAGRLGVEVDLEAVPVRPESIELCGHFGLDPYYTLTSGTLLAAMPKAKAPALLDRLRRKRIRAAIIGRFTKRARTVRSASGTKPLEPRARDEITRLFD